MARLTPISTQAADSRFAPSPFMPSPISGPTTEEINRAASQGMYAPGSFGAINAATNGTGGGAPAGPATAANPLGTLNRILGLNLGNPTENMATRQATDALPSGARVAGALGEQDDQRKAAQFAQEMGARGGLPDPSRSDYETQRKVAQHMFDTIYGTPPQNSFVPRSRDAYMGGGPSVTGQQALAAGGRELAGYGGTLVSGTTVAGGGTMQNGSVAPGTHNSFMLRQNPATVPPAGAFMPPSQPAQAPVAAAGPSPAAMQFLQDGIDPNAAVTAPQVVAGQQQQNGTSAPQSSQAAGQGSAFDQAKSQYDKTLKAALAPRAKQTIEPGYEQDPNNPGSVRPIPGSKAEMERNTTATADAEKNTQAIDQAKLVTRSINNILPKLNEMTTGPIAALTQVIPGTPAYDVKALRDTVVSNVGLKQLRAMKEASKTGASGMGQLSEKELETLQTSMGNLQLAQNTKQVASAFKDVRNSFLRWQAAHTAGKLNPNDAQGAKDIQAVKWALANPKDPSSEKILSHFND